MSARLAEFMARSARPDGRTRAAARHEDLDPGLALVLLGALLRAGMGPAAALEALAAGRACRVSSELRCAARGLEVGLTWPEAWSRAELDAGPGRLTPASRLICQTLGPVVESGAAGTALFAHAARAHRSAWSAAARRQAERAGVQLLIPLALCFLPAFLALGVGVFALALLRGVGSGP